MQCSLTSTALKNITVNKVRPLENKQAEENKNIWRKKQQHSQMMLTVTTSAASKARIMQCWFSCCSRGDGKARKQCYQHLTTDRENKALGSHLAHASKHLMSKLQLPLPVNFHNINAFITSCTSERSPGRHSARLLNAAHLPNTINQIQPFYGKKKLSK